MEQSLRLREFMEVGLGKLAPERSSLKIALIGMPGSGKSFWAEKLNRVGFSVICMDDLIAIRFKEVGIEEDLKKWVGMPFDLRYKKASKIYLNIQNEILEDLMIKLGGLDSRVVFDMSDSLIYLKQKVLTKLSLMTRIVFLDRPSSLQERLNNLYLREGKPVIWGEVYRLNHDEDCLKAVGRCYPRLLKFRVGRYRRLAEKIVKCQNYSENYSAENFLSDIS